MKTPFLLCIILLTGVISPSSHSTSLEQLCESNCKNEFNFFRKYAEQGSSLASLSLAIMYYRGQGTDVNVQTATRHLYKAARAGEPGAQYQLGYFFEHGLYLNQDLVKARNWYKQAGRKNTLDAKEKVRQLNQVLENNTTTAPTRQTSKNAVKTPAIVDHKTIEKITVVMHADYRQILKAAKAQTCNANCEPYWNSILAPLIKLKGS